MLEQHPQQLVLLVGQRDLGAVDEHAARGRLETDAGHLHDDVLAAAAAPQQCPHPGHQFREPERLADVVVGARVEADDEVHLVGACGEHQHGEVEAVRAALPADLESVHAGQAEIEDQ